MRSRFAETRAAEGLVHVALGPQGAALISDEATHARVLLEPDVRPVSGHVRATMQVPA